MLFIGRVGVPTVRNVAVFPPLRGPAGRVNWAGLGIRHGAQANRMAAREGISASCLRSGVGWFTSPGVQLFVETAMMVRPGWVVFLVYGVLGPSGVLAAGLDESRQIQAKPGKPQEIAVGERWQGTLGSGSDVDRVPKHGRLSGRFACDVCLVTLEAGSLYQIEMKSDEKTSPDLHPYLRLEDHAGQEFDAVDDNDGCLEARIVFPCRATGRYRIIATTSDSGVGSYYLQVTKLQEIGGQQEKLGNVKEITVDRPWHGTLRDGDQRDKVRGTICNVCVVTLEEGKDYQIDMKGDSKGDAYPAPLDPYLRLESEGGRHLDSNDDAPGAYGTSLSARLMFLCKSTGKYRIIATTFDGGTGGYTIQVTATRYRLKD